MKKIISILLIAVLLTSVTVTPVFALTDGCLYKDRFIEKYDDTDRWYDREEIIYLEYDYLDVDNDDAIDYALVYATLPLAHDTEHYVDMGTHFIYSDSYYYPFGTGDALYDIKNDEFIPFSKHMLTEYPFMVDYLKEHPIGTPYGDADLDNELTIMDATEIQLIVAKLSTNWGPEIEYRSDIDRDGEVTILDATAIQLALAGLDGSEDDTNNDLVYVEYDEVRYPNTYPEKPDGCQALDCDVKVNTNYFKYSSNLGYPNAFMAVIKSAEQYEYMFENSRFIGYDEEIFETHWLVASMIYTNCGEAYAKIGKVDVLGDTLYVQVNEGVNVPEDGMFTEIEPPFVSIVAVEKELLKDVTNIVRVR